MESCKICAGDIEFKTDQIPPCRCEMCERHRTICLANGSFLTRTNTDRDYRHAAHRVTNRPDIQMYQAMPVTKDKDKFGPKAMRWKGRSWPYGTCVQCKAEDRLIIPPELKRVAAGMSYSKFFPGWCRICLNSVAEEAAAVVSEMAQAQVAGEKL